MGSDLPSEISLKRMPWKIKVLCVPALPYRCPNARQSQLLEHLIHPFW